MVDDIRVTDRKNALASKWKEHSTFPVHPPRRMGESRLLYVRTKGGMVDKQKIKDYMNGMSILSNYWQHIYAMPSSKHRGFYFPLT